MAARAKTSLRAWLSDPSTYPIIAIVSFAASMATFHGVRYVRTSPDVSISKERRSDLFHRNEEEGSAFRAHRVDLAHLKSNRITQEKDFATFRERHTSDDAN
ncbi:hypothetical protein SDRG_11527 [Saprolegnia diclina VS20]|uniref:Uncharacterized protein n=1 Tax=Saprolegnia diclina (strain VS20) TaxID=1156394 RepID=T0Q808_SAPDV|nr:hypothetical protein SDRG_11527 [Saprolegnia diclina VS20]EQC30766.1 hypothetical protein SDRG_11527 [Saprolegnia diclina VS20]|eukprot:XP_008615790.1 hypothetical protein SDRG_11527 [Saprolegnia diclina VS20]